MTSALSKTLVITVASLLWLGHATAAKERFGGGGRAHSEYRPRAANGAISALLSPARALFKTLRGTARYGGSMLEAYRWSRRFGAKSAFRRLPLKHKVMTVATLMAVAYGGLQFVPPNMSNGYPMYHGTGNAPPNARYRGPQLRFFYPKKNGHMPNWVYMSTGADFKGYPEGHPVASSTRVGLNTTGKVVAVGTSKSLGKYVKVEYRGRWYGVGPKQVYRVTFGHLSSVYFIPSGAHKDRPTKKLRKLRRRPLKKGMTVRFGDILGGEGQTGYAFGSHLDMQVHQRIVTKDKRGGKSVSWEPVAPHIDAPAGVGTEHLPVDFSMKGLAQRLQRLF